MTGTITGPSTRRLARSSPWRSAAEIVAALTLGVGLLVAGGTAGISPVAPTHLLAGTAAAAAAGCQPPSRWQSTKAMAVPGVASDFDLTSFDGTNIRIHWFPDPSSDGRARPTVLMGPGWGQSGDTDTSQAGIQGALSIAQLWQGRIQRADVGPPGIR